MRTSLRLVERLKRRGALPPDFNLQDVQALLRQLPKPGILPHRKTTQALLRALGRFPKPANPPKGWLQRLREYLA